VDSLNNSLVEVEGSSVRLRVQVEVMNSKNLAILPIRMCFTRCGAWLILVGLGPPAKLIRYSANFL